MKLVKGIINFFKQNWHDDCCELPFTTHEEARFAKHHFIISGIRKDWRGRKYRQYTSLPQHNIFRELFTWREYEVN